MRPDNSEFNDASAHVMTVLGPRLLGPKVAAILLCLYATGYALLLLFFIFVAVEQLGAFIGFLGMLALAITPFMALIHLERATTPESIKPARPVFMTIIMAAPMLFWCYLTFSNFSRRFPGRSDDALMLFGFVAVPAALSLWLCVTFALLALRGTPTED